MVEKVRKLANYWQRLSKRGPVRADSESLSRCSNTQAWVDLESLFLERACHLHTIGPRLSHPADAASQNYQPQSLRLLRSSFSWKHETCKRTVISGGLAHGTVIAYSMFVHRRDSGSLRCEGTIQVLAQASCILRLCRLGTSGLQNGGKGWERGNLVWRTAVGLSIAWKHSQIATPRSSHDHSCFGFEFPVYVSVGMDPARPHRTPFAILHCFGQPCIGTRSAGSGHGLKLAKTYCSGAAHSPTPEGFARACSCSGCCRLHRSLCLHLFWFPVLRTRPDKLTKIDKNWQKLTKIDNNWPRPTQCSSPTRPSRQFWLPHRALACPCSRLAKHLQRSRNMRTGATGEALGKVEAKKIYCHAFTAARGHQNPLFPLARPETNWWTAPLWNKSFQTVVGIVGRQWVSWQPQLSVHFWPKLLSVT